MTDCRRIQRLSNWLGAVQAQDFAAAKWALGLLLQQATDAEVEKAYNTGQILRTHVMRPTWHFLSPQDIRAVLALAAHRVRAGSASMHRKLELADRLAAAKIEARGQRLAYILMDAEFAALICSGPRKGKQFTYALLEERVPKTRALSSEEALGQWTLRYFLGHGPAQARDFAWWSGLTLQEAQHGIELAKGSLLRDTSDGKTYWRTTSTPSPTGTAAPWAPSAAWSA